MVSPLSTRYPQKEWGYPRLMVSIHRLIHKPSTSHAGPPAAGQAIVFPDDASASAGSVYLSDPVKLEHLLAD